MTCHQIWLVDLLMSLLNTQQVYYLSATLFLVIWGITTASLQGIGEMFPQG